MEKIAQVDHSTSGKPRPSRLSPHSKFVLQLIHRRRSELCFRYRSTTSYFHESVWSYNGFV